MNAVPQPEVRSLKPAIHSRASASQTDPRSQKGPECRHQPRDARPALMASVLWRPLDRNHDIEELFDRIEAVEGVNDALKIQCDVFVDEHIAESREPLQPSNELW